MAIDALYSVNPFPEESKPMRGCTEFLHHYTLLIEDVSGSGSCRVATVDGHGGFNLRCGVAGIEIPGAVRRRYAALHRIHLSQNVD